MISYRYVLSLMYRYSFIWNQMVFHNSLWTGILAKVQMTPRRFVMKTYAFIIYDFLHWILSYDVLAIMVSHSCR